MRLPLLVALFASLASPCSPAQIVERPKLTEGVESLARPGLPGPVAIYGQNAFAIATAPQGKSQVAVAAAGPLGQGRVVIFGHDGFLTDGTDAAARRLLLNAVRWAGRKEQPRVALRGVREVKALGEAGMSVKKIPQIDAAALAGCDALVLNAQLFTNAAEAAAVADFIKRGGGLVAGMTGWAFGTSSGGQEFATAHQGNAVLAEAGLAWTTGMIARGVGRLPVAADIPPMLNAVTVLRELGKQTDVAVIEQGVRTLQVAFEALPPGVQPAWQKALGGLMSANLSAPAAGMIQAGLSRFLPPQEVRPAPEADRFPGRVPKGAVSQARTREIDPRAPGWHSTGLYADAGALVRVLIPAEVAQEGYTLRIGCHADALHHLANLKRAPEITLAVPLRAAQTAAASPFGGLLYIVVPEKVKSEKPFAVTIAGAVDAPLFILGKITDAQWEQLRQLPAPWAELACAGVILTVPSEVAREIRNPTELMKFWQSVIDAQDRLSSVAAARRRPERIVPDLQISAGFMHSGYPIMIHLPEAREMVTLAKDQAPGWGFFHELGHNHQMPEWTFEGTGEVTCNIFSLYITEVLQKQARGANHPALKPEARAKRRAEYISGGRNFEKWKSDPFLALEIYMQLIDGFGWETMERVLRSYQSPDFGAPPKDDQQKRDQWMVRYARIAGKNLAPLFDAWGIAVTAEAKAGIASLPSWLPAE